MLNLNKHTLHLHTYPLDKARKILEEDGIKLTDYELEQFVNILTLLAQQEAELSTKTTNNIYE